jgi:hypothetical protein
MWLHCDVYYIVQIIREKGKRMVMGDILGDLASPNSTL